MTTRPQAYTHVQSSPAQTWTVNHNLDCAPVSDVVTELGQKILPQSVKHMDANTLQMIFSEPTAGTARLVGRYRFTLSSTNSVDPGAAHGTPSTPSYLLFDTFTGADGTNLGSHAADVGGSWIQAGLIDANGMRIYDGMLRRPTEAEVPSSGTGTRTFYNTATLPATGFYVEYQVQFGGTGFGELTLSRDGSDVQNADKFIRLTFRDTEDNILAGWVDGYVEFPFTQLNTPYLIRHEFTGGGTDTYIDGVYQFTDNIGSNWFFGPLGVSIYDQTGDAIIRIDNLKVGNL